MTTQTTVPETMTRLATVAEASQVAGRNGLTQWALRLIVKDVSPNGYPFPCFMPLDRASQVLKGSTHLVTIRRGAMKPDQAGKPPRDGTIAWDYQWDLTGWDVQAPSALPSTPAATPQETGSPVPVPWDAADTQSRISWAQAVNLAVECLKGFNSGWSRSDYLKGVELWANHFYPLIRKGPTPQAEPLFPEGGDDPRDLPDEEYEEHREQDGHGGADVVREPVAPSQKHFPIWDKKVQTDWQYITGVAKDLYKKDQQDFRQLLGKSWAEWVKEHGTPEAAIQAAVLRMTEQ